jgi:hypothetical protein
MKTIRRIGDLGDLGSWRCRPRPRRGGPTPVGSPPWCPAPDPGGTPAWLPGRPATVVTSRTSRADAVVTP